MPQPASIAKKAINQQLISSKRQAIKISILNSSIPLLRVRIPAQVVLAHLHQKKNESGTEIGNSLEFDFIVHPRTVE